MTSDAIDASAPTRRDHSASLSAAPRSASRTPRRLLDRLAAGTPYAVGFGGQGVDWLPGLAELVRTHALDLSGLIAESEALLAPVRADLGPTAQGFAPLAWVDAHLAASSESVDTDGDAAAVPPLEERTAPAYALPGVLLAQAAALTAIRGLGLDPRGAVTAIGHSQGLLAVEIVDGADPAEVLALARLIGAATQQVAPGLGLAGETMLGVSLPLAEVEEIIAGLPASSRLVAGVRNGRASTVVSGTPRGIERLQEALPKDVTSDVLLIGAAFHHPELTPAVDLVVDLAERAGLDVERAGRLARALLVEGLDWPAEVASASGAGARWLVDLGPGDLISRVSRPLAAAHGIGTIAPVTPTGLRELTVLGAAPQQPQGWDRFAPSVVRLPDGTVHAETRFTRLTGRSPILLAGMTPTTVDPAIVAAAANAGHWAELAGGGQVTEPVFAANLARLRELLEPGRTAAFNALYLDPYLWRLQVASQRLVQKARAAGAPFDAVVVTAGVPELSEAADLVAELREAGIEHVVFKPGTVAQIRSVLAIADEVAPTPLIVQIEGGKAGGHHSWEDLDSLLLATYADLRRRENVVVCVGGGIGTPSVAARYVSGAWSEEYAEPRMPLDGVLVGTAAMACLEATTSPAVKQLLVDTTPDQVVSGRSQLGADIHEIDNAASRCGALLDTVAGDADAVAERRDEIIAALALTAKPYFGDVLSMTYAEWLGRFLELSSDGSGWLDETIRDRFHEMLQRAEARLADADHGPIPTLFESPADVEDGAAALAVLTDAYAAGVRLHPADLPFFLEVCTRPGKPVPFVPVIDQDVRRWYRSDSLWQAHDARYGADAVVVIPGPDAVGGITRADEPVAELLCRFEAAVVASVEDAAIQDVPGRRRTDDAEGVLALALAAPDAVWGGRTVVNPLRRLVSADSTTEVAIEVEGDAVVATVPLSRGSLRLRLLVDDAVASGAAPVVDAPAEAMRDLLAFAAGGSSVLDKRLLTAHAAVTAVGRTRVEPVLDVLVGLAWPAVFAALSAREDVAEGFLDLVHLDHSIAGSIPNTPVEPEVAASLVDVRDTEVGRVASVAVRVGGVLLTERFAIRGRTSTAKLADPAGAGGVAEVAPAERRSRGRVTVTAPTDLRPFAEVTGDHNPIHTNDAVARLAGLRGPIVHGMWISATAQRALAETLGRPVEGWTARFLAPVSPGAKVDLAFTRVGFSHGDEVVEVQASVLTEDGSTLVMTATARVRAARTAYVFPGQGIQKQGMGMEGYARSAAAKEIWDRADQHTRKVLGFSVLRVVKDNPTELLVDGTWHRHPDGVLFLTQFTQVAMAVLGSAQMAEMIEAGVAVDDAVIAGHSVGEYNALAAVSGVLELEAVVEIVFRRGSVMHTLVPRDAEGRSDYRLAAIRPAQFDCADDDVAAFIDSVAETSGEFLQIANLNLRGSQYAIAGTVAGMDALQAEIEKRRAAYGGKAAFVLVPGIDVPFHSRVLADGVSDFRQKLDELLPPVVDPALLVGRYVPNLVARPFALDRAFLEAILEVAPADAIRVALDDFDAWAGRDGELCRLLLVELLAWQFASPVRWIETQDLLFADAADGGLGVERLIEVGVGSAPTLANIAASTLKVPEVRRTLAGPVEVLNLERDANVVFGRDQDEVVEPDVEPATDAAPAEAKAAPVAAPASVSTSAAQDVADLPFTAADATTLLLAWWTKSHPDALAPTDSIESLTDGASSRRNQLLMDLGAELGLGAIDGAAEAPIAQLTGQVQGLARGYKPFGPVLTAALGDQLKKVLGPIGARQSSVTDRVTQTWQLSAGWGSHVLAELALASRESSVSSLDDAVDAAVQVVAERNGVSVALPSTGEAGGGVIDSAAAAELTGGITDALVASARTILSRLDGASVAPVSTGSNAEALAVVARVESELGSDWMRLTTPKFDERRAVLFDDRWASARTDVVRAALGNAPQADLTGAGEAVAAIARFHGLDALAEQALDTTPGTWSGEVAVVTGAGPDSIAESVVAALLAGGATVVATTSNDSPERIARFRDLYARTARAGAALWVVPANLAAYADVDALVDWVRNEQVKRVGPKTEVLKPALHPTLLFPFAAGPAAGDLADAGAQSEAQARILLWSVERLIGATWGDQRVHVVLPGSPNRGTFGGDGAYGETKAALDAIVAKWSAERGWPERVTLAHAVIGWVAGTGLMGGNDPMIDAARAAGVRVWSPEEMAAELLSLCTVEAREQAAERPLHADFAEGLEGVNLRDIAAGMSMPKAAAEDEITTIAALPASPAAIAEPARPEVAHPALAVDDMVVIVGAAELGPWGSSRTRHEVEVGELSAAGVLELAWSTGLVRWDEQGRTWRATEGDEAVAEHEIFERFHDVVVERCGIREYADDNSMVDGTAPLLVGVFLEDDLTFNVDTEAEARALQASHPEQTRIAPAADGWTVTRLAGTQIRVPRRMKLTRTVGGQIPTGFDPTGWGIPKEMVDTVDRLALWNLVCTVDAFLASGFTPAELMRWVHPSLVANTQGTGMGGMTSMQSLYLDTLLGEPVANDLLQEALPNVVAAHVMQSYVGGYGAMSHPVGACATTAISIEDGMDKIRLGKADFVVAGGYDDLGAEGVIGFAAMSATADTEAMRAQGIADNRFSRANDRRRGGFVEGQGGGTVLLARGSVAARMGLPVLGVVAYAASYADGIHSSIPAPGLGALAAGRGRENSPLARALESHGLKADDVAVISKHDTSTAANDPNEADLHERLAAAIGRSEGNPLHVVSQKTLTGHAKGGAAAFQVIGLCQTLAAGVIPPNRSLDCVDPEMAKHPHLVWHREALRTGPLKAGLVTSLGFGHVAGIVAIAHPEVFVAALPADEQDAYRAAARERRIAGALRVARTMLGEPGFVRRSDRRLGEETPKELEADVLLNADARLDESGVYEWCKR
ncbi:fatty acid synthase subunit beta domain-containing protein [Nocardioides montaniterrae]